MNKTPSPKTTAEEGVDFETRLQRMMKKAPSTPRSEEIPIIPDNTPNQTSENPRHVKVVHTGRGSTDIVDDEEE